MTTLASRADVLGFFGEADEAGLSRRVYKSTDCGAWAKFETRFVQTGERKRTWTAFLQKGINGVHVHGAIEDFQPNDVFPATNWSAVLPAAVVPADLPANVREYLTLTAAGTLCNVTGEDFDALATAGGWQTVVAVSPIQKLITFVLTEPVGEERDGFLIGSIVEGSDAEVPPEWLPFPFTSDDLDKAVQNIEAEADRLWQEANG